ncbi:hypothetical protein BC332_00995 [Capsicum chinense]|nr:hypothetical protein BC332_00995 [Capsicum chinense]
MTSSRKRTQTSEIEKLAVMIPTYLQYNNFFEQKVPTNWTALTSYKGKTGRDHVSDIAQQESGSVYVFEMISLAVYVKYLSEVLDIPSSKIDAYYHRSRYASLLCKYGSVKA